MLSIMLAVAVLGAEPKAVSGSEYYLEATETLDRCKNDKDLAKAVQRLNKEWSKKIIVVEFQVMRHGANNVFFMESREKSGDWITAAFDSWCQNKQKPEVSSSLTFSGVPQIVPKPKSGETIGTLHIAQGNLSVNLGQPSVKVEPPNN